MKDTKVIESMITFSDELGKIGLKISNEIYGQTYLEEEDLQQRIGHLFLKKDYPVLREVGLPKKVFDVTFKKGEFPDFVFFDDVNSGFSNPFIIEFKHKEKIIDQHRSQLGRQLNLAQETVVNKNKNLKFGYVWNIVKTDFSTDNSLQFESVLNKTLKNFETSDNGDKDLLITQLLNLYLVEYNFYASGKDREKVMTKIKKLLESKEFLNMDRTSFSSNFINEFEILNKALNPTLHNSTITKGVTMKIKKPDVRVEVELWQLTNGNNKELGIELVERKTYG
tara:strand:+ start:8057 stop:8899 length:843 start_codon:yes stop_codon:yes gene_type:complete